MNLTVNYLSFFGEFNFETVLAIISVILSFIGLFLGGKAYKYFKIRINKLEIGKIENYENCNFIDNSHVNKTNYIENYKTESRFVDENKNSDNELNDKNNLRKQLQDLFEEVKNKKSS
jgi:uncharacterized membrane protein YciS (DUF1049 family)